MSGKIKKTADESGAALLPMSIVTNGVLLTPDVAKDLSVVGFQVAQVSFDSLFDDGDTKRGVIARDGSQSEILKNIIIAREYLKIRIRINISKSNQHEYQEIQSVLRLHQLDKLSYLARVSDFEGEAGVRVDRNGRRHRDGLTDSELSEIRESEDALRRKEFAELEIRALRADPGSINTIANKLTPKVSFCRATSGNLIVIDPDGDISRCWLSAGSRSESLGNVRDVAAEHNSVEVNKKWLRASPFSYKECSSCRVLPLCMGGCSHPRVFMNARKPPCEAIKYQIDSCIDLIGRRLVPGELQQEAKIEQGGS